MSERTGLIKVPVVRLHFINTDYFVDFRVFCPAQVAMNPSNTVFDAKRLIGRKFDDPTVQSDMKYWPFTVINEATKPKIKVDYKNESKTFFPEEISSMVLVKMKETAEAYLGKVSTRWPTIKRPEILL